MKPLLTIAIPTYNRAAKLKRLLYMLQKEIIAHRLEERIVVIVSDNASKDETPSTASGFAGSFRHFVSYRQDENIGFDGNCRFLYAHADTRYVWFMADDDMPLAGALPRVVDVVETLGPDVLLFSFIQPPGSEVRQFDYSEPVRVVTDPVDAIDHVLRYTKISIYVLRKINFNPMQWKELNSNVGGGWFYISLAFSVLEASENILLAVISEPLAACDEDYSTIAWVPTPFLNLDQPVKHSFVLKHRMEIIRRYPKLLKFYNHSEGYYNAILCSFAAKSGSLLPEHVEEYDKFIKELDWRLMILLRRPRSLIQFIALKLRIANYWPHIRLVTRRLKESFP
jgi:glycosyltransferase involved in cell wall biosynthesis